MPDWKALLAEHGPDLVMSLLAAKTGGLPAATGYRRGVQARRAGEALSAQQAQQTERQARLDAERLAAEQFSQNLRTREFESQEKTRAQTRLDEVSALAEQGLQSAAENAPDLTSALTQGAALTSRLEQDYGLKQGRLAGRLAGMSVRRQRQTKAYARQELARAEKTLNKDDNNPDWETTATLTVKPGSLLAPHANEQGLVPMSTVRELAEIPLITGPRPKAEKRAFLETGRVQKLVDVNALPLGQEFPLRTPAPGQGSTVIIQTPEGLATFNKATRQVEPITSDGSQLPVPQGAIERQQARGFERAGPIIDAISELSARINVNRGVEATAKGVVERNKARINLNDDVSEYEALVSGFTPLVARAVGHSGVLTEQDVKSVRKLFPTETDSKNVRDRKVARIKSVMSSVQSINRPGVSTAGPSGATPPGPSMRVLTYDEVMAGGR